LLAAGRKLGRYQLRQSLGVGGMSAVYRAYDPVIDREVALKVLPPEMGRDETLRLRFQEEARALAKLNHRNLVKIYAVGEEGPVSFYAMELVQGLSLRQVLAARGALPWRQALAVFVQLLAGLEAVHRCGIIHRDLKPGNLMLEPSGRVVLMDFGLSRRAERQNLTALGAVLGTPKYISPEQALGEPAGEPSDLYSAGVVLFEMLAGQPPFSGEDNISLLRRHVESPAPDIAEAAPETPEALRLLLANLLAKSPKERYPHVKEALATLAGLAPEAPAAVQAVRELMATEASSAPPEPRAAGPEGPPAAPARFERSEMLRTWVALIAAVASVLALILALVALFHERVLPSSQAPLRRATPQPGSHWQVTRFDGSQFVGELVHIEPDPAGGAIWTFRLPDGGQESLPDSRFTLKRQWEGGENP